jgi:hypothetical protein
VNVTVILKNLVDHAGKVIANVHNVHVIVPDLKLTLTTQTLQLATN